MALVESVLGGNAMRLIGGGESWFARHDRITLPEPSGARIACRRTAGIPKEVSCICSGNGLGARVLNAQRRLALLGPSVVK